MTEVKRVCLGGIFLLASLLAASAGAEQIAIRGGTLLPVSTNPVSDGIVLIENGKILAVGADVVVPGGAREIDAKGKFIVPGFMDAQSCLYVVDGEPRLIQGAPDWNVTDGLDPFVEGWEEVLAQGVTAVYVSPPARSGIAGRGAVLHLNGAKTPAKLVLKADAAVRANLGVSLNNQSSSLARLNDYANLRETLIETQAYMQRKRRYEQDLAEYEKKRKAEQGKDDKKEEKKEDAAAREKKPQDLKRPDKPGTDPAHEILGKVLDKKIPLQITAHRVQDILNAMRLAEEFQFSLILDGCTEGYLVAEEIARRKVPVIAGPVSTSFAGVPQVDYRNHDPRNAGILADKGVQTAIGVGGRDGLSSKFIATAAGLAVANGMDKDAALRAITLTPAEILGVADRIGSLDAGKDADILIMTGPPLDTASQVVTVLIEGKIVYERKPSP
jgi:imidazolonepropionase-like amidohydrolase